MSCVSAEVMSAMLSAKATDMANTMQSPVVWLTMKCKPMMENRHQPHPRVDARVRVDAPPPPPSSSPTTNDPSIRRQAAGDGAVIVQAFYDTGNHVGPLISLRKLLELEYTMDHVNKSDSLPEGRRPSLMTFCRSRQNQV